MTSPWSASLSRLFMQPVISFHYGAFRAFMYASGVCKSCIALGGVVIEFLGEGEVH